MRENYNWYFSSFDILVCNICVLMILYKFEVCWDLFVFLEFQLCRHARPTHQLKWNSQLSHSPANTCILTTLCGGSFTARKNMIMGDCLRNRIF
jgi:hypothetical protein